MFLKVFGIRLMFVLLKKKVLFKDGAKMKKVTVNSPKKEKIFRSILKMLLKVFGIMIMFLLHDLKILLMKKGFFNPQAFITREEVAEILFRVILSKRMGPIHDLTSMEKV